MRFLRFNHCAITVSLFSAPPESSRSPDEDEVLRSRTSRTLLAVERASDVWRSRLTQQRVLPGGAP